MQKHRRPIGQKKKGRKKPCVTGKVRYRDLSEAKVALNRTQARHNMGESHRAEARAYPCHLCKGWHLTSRGERK